MGVKTHMIAYDKYVKKCKQNKIKPISLIDFILKQES